MKIIIDIIETIEEFDKDFAEDFRSDLELTLGNLKELDAEVYGITKFKVVIIDETEIDLDKSVKNMLLAIRNGEFNQINQEIIENINTNQK